MKATASTKMLGRIIMDGPITPQGVGGLVGALTLTVSGPGFLAGYGPSAAR
jgi:hypothetical protein